MIPNGTRRNQAEHAGSYPVRLEYTIPGREGSYPLCETAWTHDPRSRSLALVLPVEGRRTPRVMGFDDFRVETQDSSTK